MIMKQKYFTLMIVWAFLISFFPPQNNLGAQSKKLENQRIVVDKPELVDFVINEFKTPQKAVSPGSILRMSYEIENQGSSPAEADVHIYLSKTLNDLTADTLIFSESYNVYPMTLTGEGRVDHIISLTHPQGEYYLTLVVDPENKVAETNERNNKKFWPVVIKHVPRQAAVASPQLNTDLGVYDLTVSDNDVNDGEPFTVNFKLKNLGNTRVTEVEYCLILGYFALFWGKVEVELIQGKYLNIDIGSEMNFSQTFRVPWNIDPDPIREIILILDPEEKIGDSIRTNHFLSLPFKVTVRGRGDLTVQRLRNRRRGLLEEGTFFDVDFTIKNIGTRRTEPCVYIATLQKYVDYYTQGDGRSVRVTGWQTVKSHRNTVNALDPNQTMTGSLRYRMPDRALRLKIIMRVDYDQEMIELDERNNIREIVWQ